MDGDENENEVTVAGTPAPKAAANGGPAPKVTPVRAAAKPATGFGKNVDWKPDDGWKGRYADDRWGEVAARALLKGHQLRDIRVTIARLNRDQTEQRLCTFSGDTVEGRNNPYTTGGNTGLGGVISPSDALFSVIRQYHAGSTESGVYNVEFWDLRNDSKQITSAMMPIAPSGQTGKMDQIIANMKQPQGDGGGFDPTVRPQGQGQGLGQPQVYPQGPAGFSGYSGMQPLQAPQYPAGADPTVMNLFNQMQEMQRRHYEELSAMAQRAGAPPPAPPPGLGSLPDDPRIALLQKELELTRAQLPKPKSDTEILAEKMVSGFAAILDKKFPNVGIGAAVGVGGSPETPQVPLTNAQKLRQRLEEMKEELSIEDEFKKIRAKYGVGEAPEAPEAEVVPAEPPKPEDKLPVNLVPIEGLQLFGQPFHSVSRKDGEEVGLGQQIIDHIMYNPGAQEQAMRFVMAVGEKVAEPLMNVLTRIGQATAVKQGGGQGQVGVGNVSGGNQQSQASQSSYRAEVVAEVPNGAVDANEKPGNDDGGVI